MANHAEAARPHNVWNEILEVDNLSTSLDMLSWRTSDQSPRLRSLKRGPQLQPGTNSYSLNVVFVTSVYITDILHIQKKKGGGHNSTLLTPLVFP
eukprot:1158335-Pelagomonas_calceolata.AAC.15